MPPCSNYYPGFRAFSSIIVICILTIGIIYVGGLTAVAMIFIMISSYIAMSVFITPALRMASSRKIRTRNQFTQTFLESFKSIKDIKLAGNKGYFINNFVKVLLNSSALIRSLLYCLKFLEC